MKQWKKLLCVLLAMVLAFSCLTVGVSAAKVGWTDYNTPKEYDVVKNPVFTPDQGASALLDMIDNLLAEEVGLNETYVGVHIEITSLNSTLDTLDEVLNNWAVRVVEFFANLGDLEDIDRDIPSGRREQMTDLAFMSVVFSFFADNADPLYKFIGNRFEVGFIDTWFDPKEEIPQLTDIHGLVNELVYGLIIEDIDFEDSANAAKKAQVDAMTLDGILQDFLDNRLIKFVADLLADVEDGVPTNPVAEFLGLPMNADGTLKEWIGLQSDLFPSLKANPDSTSITKTSLYDWIHNIFHALIDDVAVKYGGELILEALDLDPDDTEATELSYIDIAIGLFVTEEDFPNGFPEGTNDVVSAFLYTQGCPNPTHPRALDKLNASLKYILGTGVKLHDEDVYEGIQKFIRFEDDGLGGRYLKLDDMFEKDLATYVKMVVPMLYGLAPDTFPEMSKEEEDKLNAMNDEQTFAYLVQYLLENLVDGVNFNYEQDCNTIKELATWTLVDVAAELMPDVDFEGKIASGEIIPNSDDCLDIASAVVSYYLNGEFGMNIVYEGATFEGVLTQAFEFFLKKYAVLFTRTAYTGGVSDRKVWHDLYETVNQWIPLTNIVYGVNNNENGMRQIVMDKIINAVLEFDLSSLFSIVGVRANADAEFKKPLCKIVANLLARVINGVFHLSPEGAAGVDQKTLIIPYSYSTLDQILTLNPADKSGDLTLGLQNTAYRLIKNLTKLTDGEDSLAVNSADLLAQLIGAIDLDNFEYMLFKFRQSGSTGTYSINDLRMLYNRLALTDNEGKKYYEDGYGFFHMVDFTPWSYLDFKSALSDAGSLIEQQDKANAGSGTAPSRKDITFAFYSLSQYEILLNENRRAASDFQLDKVIAKYTDNAQSSKYKYVADLIAHIGTDFENKDASGNYLYTDRTYNAFKNAWLFAQKVSAEFKAVPDGRKYEYRQSKINTARRELIDAVQRLKSYVPIADYTALDRAMETVRTSTSSPSTFTSESVQKVIKAYMFAKNLDRDYDVEEQSIVDNATDDLNRMVDNLKNTTYLYLFNEEAQYINFDKKIVYGLGFGFYSRQDEIDWSEDFDLYFSSTFGYGVPGDDAEYVSFNIQQTEIGSGTGSKILLLDDSDGDGVYKYLTGYDVAIFGDINGDSYCDGMDSIVMKMYTGLMLDKDMVADYVYAAGDVNSDGTIGITDANIASNYGVGMQTVEIDQCPESVKSEALTFADLVA